MRVRDAGMEPDKSTLVDTLRARAEQQGGKLAFTFATEGDAGPKVAVSYSDLDLRARAIAVQLRALELEGERVLLLYPPGLEFIAAFFGCLYAGVVGVPAHLPRPNRPMDRLRSIVDDAGPMAVLTGSSLLTEAERWSAEIPGLAGRHRIATDLVDEALATDWVKPKLPEDRLAFLQYTSGSTSAPKGVMISHGNLIHNSEQIRACFGSTTESRGVFWLPLYHDMGLIGGVLQTVYCGGSSTLFPPTSFLQRPLRWLQAISATGATISGGPDFAYDLCVRKILPEQRIGLDLSRWAVAFNGAEPVRAETLDRFVEAFGPCGFRREAFLPCYGLAESTLLASGFRARRHPAVIELSASALGRNRVEPPATPDDARIAVGSGAIPEGNDVAIIDPETGARCPDGQVGEICVHGPSVAGGYWNRPDASAATFGTVLPETGAGPFLRTGDLGFLRDGDLFVAGRLKDLMIIGGRNVYPNDVEWTAEHSHPALRAGGGGAFSIEVDGRERVVVLLELERAGKSLPVDEIVAGVRKAVAEAHDVDLHAVRLLRPMSLPRTSSGKVRRHACREAFLDGTLETVGEWTQSVETRPIVAAAMPEQSSPRTRSATEIAAWLARQIAVPLGVPADAIDHRGTFSGFGLGSIQAVGLAGELEKWLDQPLSATLLYDYPTIEALAQHLAGEVQPELSVSAIRPNTEPVAIIGIGCRFPGADSPDAFWRLLSEGVDAIRPIPEGRRLSGMPDDDRVDFRLGGFLDRVDRFDADFFGISPREAIAMDPQQRLLLEVAWEAMEDAGLAPGRLAGSPVGVFVGIATDDYSRLRIDDDTTGDVYEITGNAASIAANRISYAFDFRGPSVALDTACSSSLVAVEWACRSLRQGESTLAIAGGVNLILDDDVSDNFARAGFLAADGRCKTFSAEADGYVRGEGAGVVVLKPLSQAIADGNPIYAVIRGAAINQDGRTNGLTAPSRHAQEAVLRTAYGAAGIAPGRVQYVEAHGTGTPLGDPIEALALGTVLAEGRAAGDACLLGSVKTNIGHLEAAAGVAGLIKVALMLQHRAVPPSLHCRETNPQIPLGSLPLRLAREMTRWPESETPLIAGVSSFGFGGTNVHMVIESAPDRPDSPRDQTTETGRDLLWPLSARSPEALRDLAAAVRNDLSSRVDIRAGEYARSVARREHHDHRLAIVAQSVDAAATSLDAFLEGKSDARLSAGRRPPGREPSVVFVFSGQGGIWSGAGRDLFDQEPAYRAAIVACDRLLKASEGRSLVDELGDEQTEPLGDPEFAQTHQFALQVGLAALYRSWGIVPDAVVGHSLGEIAAAHVAGALDLADALRIVVLRARLMKRMAGQGKTAAVGISADTALRRFNGRGDLLSIAAINAPNMVTVSGDAATLDSFVQTLRDEGRFARMLDVDCAFHSPQMDPLRREMETTLRGLEPRAAAIPFVSTVFGRQVDPRELVGSYWGRNLRDPVLFSAAIESLADVPNRSFLEIGPHPIHRGSIAECLAGRAGALKPLGSLRRREAGRTSVQLALGDLYTRGHSVAWDRLYPLGQNVRLPSYPWQRKSYWIERSDRRPSPSRNGRSGSNGNGHPHGDADPYRLAKSLETNRVSGSESLLYQVEWRPLDIRIAVASRDFAGRWIVVSDRGGVGESLASFFEGHGGTCDLVDASAIADALDSRRGPCRGLVYLSGLDPQSTANLDEAQRRVCGGALQLLEALNDHPASIPARLWLVTRGTQPVAPTSTPLDVNQATLWGLGRSIAQSHPQLWGGVIDLDPATDSGEVERIATLVRDAGAEDQLAFRNGRSFVPRLLPSEPTGEPGKAARFRPEGTYLITGGFGELGIRVARWMVEQGARRIVLVGRRGLPDRGEWNGLAEGDPIRARVRAVSEMERLGATIIPARGDVGNRDEMASLFERLRQTLPPIVGVVHAAGVVRVHDLGEFDTEGFLSVIRPKVAGAWTLHELTQSMPLDFFATFSSVASVLGSRKLADYSAANSFLDALAHHRATLGLPGLSINWGPWAGAGMVDDSGSARALELMGLRALHPDQGLAALGALLLDPSTHQRMVASVDWTTFRSLHGHDGRGRLLAEVETARPDDVRTSRLLEIPREIRGARLVEMLRDRVAEALRLPRGEPDVDRPLNRLGIDSIVAMELKAGIEADLGAVVPMTAFLESTSVAQLAERMLKDLDEPVDSTAVLLEPGNIGAGDQPPSVGQQSLWYAHQLSPNPGAFNIAGAATIRPGLDPEILRRVLGKLVIRHEALRTTYPEVAGKPLLRVHETIEPEFHLESAAAWDSDERSRRRADEANRPFDLEHGPLIRAHVWTRSEAETDVLIVVHHIIGDFWTMAILVDELIRLYTAEMTGGSADLPPLTLRYTDFARWQGEMLAGAEGLRLDAYWRKSLEDEPPVLNLPTDRPRPAVRTDRGAVRHFDLDEGLSRAVVAFAREQGASLYTVLLTAFQVLLGRYSGQDDFAIGSPVAGRTRPGLDALMGYFINLVPMRAKLSGNPTFEDLLGRVRQTVHDGLEHQDYPFGRIVEELAGSHDPGRSPIFQVMFIYQKSQRLNGSGLSPFALGAGGHRVDAGGLSVESLAVERRASLFDLTLIAARNANRISLALEYSTDLFDASTADRMLECFGTLLTGIVADRGRRLAELPLLTESERHRVTSDWSAPEAAPESLGVCIHRLFEARAVTAPESIAVVHEGRRTPYGELNIAANRMACRLTDLGVGRGSIVGLCGERSPELLAGLLGILKAGAAYLPLDPATPPERLALMLADAGVDVLLVDPASIAAMAGRASMVIGLGGDEELSEPVVLPTPSTTEDDPAYVIYTSGSTGEPKGVVLTHRNLASAYQAWERAYHLTSLDGPHLQAAGVAFDVFTGDWTRALCSGGTLVLCPRETLVEPEALFTLMTRERVAFAEFVPAVVEALIRWLDRTDKSLDFLRIIVVGSDMWRVGSYRRLRHRVGPETRVINSYGLTETTIDSTYFEGSLAGLADDRPVPIGRPIAGTRAFVLDRNLQPAPPGVPGELLIGGPGVSLGYLNRPALTAERFLPDPFGPPGGRLYRTGDLARWREDGALELLGRSDYQVKIRGVRIELGEVESALLRHPSVRDAAVLVRDEASGGRSLVAYIVARTLPAPEIAELRRWLVGLLPEAMIPAAILALDTMPLSANGKVDRRALAAIEAPAAPREASVDPRTPLEMRLARIALDVLGIDRIGVHDNFLELGLDSILIIQFASRARREGLRLDPGLFFRHPSIAELAAELPDQTDGVAASPTPAPTIAPIDHDFLGLTLSDHPGLEDAYPLSPVQEGMLFHSAADPDAGAYIEQFTCRLHGAIDTRAFATAWRSLIDRHPSLRTAIEWHESDRPVQAVHRDVDLPIRRDDWRDASPESQDERLAEYLRSDRRQGFVPSVAPMLRVALFESGLDEHIMVWSSHHLILDGWCFPILLGDLLAFYEAAIRGVETGLPPVAPFRNYIAWLRRQELTSAEAFWRRGLAGVASPTPLGLEEARRSIEAGALPFEEVEVNLDESTTSVLRSVARSAQLTLASLVEGAWALLLARYSGRRDVVFGLTVSGRPAELEGIESMVGVFINTLPMRVAVDEDAKVLPWLREVQRGIVELRRFESSPLIKVQEWSDIPRGRPLFESIVIVQNTPGDLGLTAGRGLLGIEDVRIFDQTNYPITLTIIPGAALQIRIGYDARRFEASAVARMIGHYQTLLAGIAENPDRPIADITMLTTSERESLVDRSPAPGAGVASDEGPGSTPVPPDLHRLDDDELDAYIAEVRRSIGETAR
jgi:amino acid adenylation domain-containing protein